VFTHQKKPVAAPGHIASHRAVAGNRNDDVGAMAVRRHILNRHLPVGKQLDLNGANWGLNQVFARLDAPQQRECLGDTDHPVAAHAQISRVIKENDPRRAGRSHRLQKECPDQDIGAARFA